MWPVNAKQMDQSQGSSGGRQGSHARGVQTEAEVEAIYYREENVYMLV